MSGRREPKKSETLEVRVSHEAKSALMRKAQAEGRSASDVIRESIASYLAGQPKEARSMFITSWKPAAALGAGALALVWSLILPTSAFAGPDLKATFQSFDSNGDGSVTLEEFRAGHVADRLVSPSQNAKVHPGPVMVVLRKNDKVSLTGKETQAELLAAHFQRQDSNGNGTVDLVEFEAFHRTAMKAAFGTADVDKDGAIEPTELSALARYLPPGSPQPAFSELDSNRDGGLSEDEYFAAPR